MSNLQLLLDLGEVQPRVLIVSHRPFLRTFVAEVLTRAVGAEIVGVCGSHADLLADVSKAAAANVMVLDATRTDSLFQLIQGARQSARGCRALVVTAAAGDYVPTRALACGAGGIITEEDEPDEWADAVRTVARGGVYQSAGCVCRGNALSVSGRFTPQESRILPLACRGMSDEAIGQALTISPTTVEGHRVSIMRKLGVSDAAGLFVVGIVMGVAAASEIDYSSRVRRSAGGSRKK